MDKFKVAISRKEFFNAVAETIKAEWPTVRFMSSKGLEEPSAGNVAALKDWSALADRLGIPKECQHEATTVGYSYHIDGDSSLRTISSTALAPICKYCGEELIPTWTAK